MTLSFPFWYLTLSSHWSKENIYPLSCSDTLEQQSHHREYRHLGLPIALPSIQPHLLSPGTCLPIALSSLPTCSLEMPTWRGLRTHSQNPCPAPYSWSSAHTSPVPSCTLHIPAELHYEGQRICVRCLWSYRKDVWALTQIYPSAYCNSPLCLPKLLNWDSFVKKLHSPRLDHPNLNISSVYSWDFPWHKSPQHPKC